MGYRAKLERASLKMGAKFKDYRPETGTWVFTVPHFTKYGLTVNFSYSGRYFSHGYLLFSFIFMIFYFH